jgi:hypothetical protein
MVVEGSSDARGGRRGCMAWSTESSASYLSSWWARSLATCILVSFDSPCVLKNMKQKCDVVCADCLLGNCRLPVDQDRRPESRADILVGLISQCAKDHTELLQWAVAIARVWIDSTERRRDYSRTSALTFFQWEKRFLVNVTRLNWTE